MSLALTPCNFKSALAIAGTSNEAAIVQQTTTAVELVKEHSTVLGQLRSKQTIDAELYQLVQVSDFSIQDEVAIF